VLTNDRRTLIGRCAHGSRVARPSLDINSTGTVRVIR
jgi:hypothetical protein